MGTWGTDILESDSAMDLYSSFEEQYNQKTDVETIKKNIIRDFGLFTESGEAVYEDNTPEWLAYAQICWECKALDEATLKHIQHIVDKEIDKENWEDLWKERKAAELKFLEEISVPKARKKPIRKTYSFDVPFEPGDCIIFKDSDGTYGGAICFDIIKEDAYGDEVKRRTKDWFSYVIGMTRIRQHEKPTLEDFYNSHIVVKNFGEADGEKAGWIDRPQPELDNYYIGTIKSEKELEEVRNCKLFTDFEKAGKLRIKKAPTTNVSCPMVGWWGHNIYQLAWEKKHPESIDLSYPIKNYCEPPEGYQHSEKKGGLFGLFRKKR